MRLVTTDGDGEARTVTLAHEKLIDAWPWLRQLVDENREMIALQNQINDDAAAWARSKDAGYLYRGGRLIQVEERLETLSPVLTALSQTFIQASLDRRRQEIEEKEAQRRRTITILAAAFGVTLVFAVVAFLFFLRSNDSAKAANENLATATAALIVAETANADAVFQRNEAATSEANALAGEATALAANAAEANARATSEAEANIRATAVVEAENSAARALEQAAVAQSRSLASASLETGHKNDMAALLLAAAAGQEAETTLAFTALYTQLPFMPPPRQTFAHEDTVLGAAWNGDESQILTWSKDGTAVLWDAASGARRQTFAHERAILGAVWNGDGSRILTWSEDGTAKVWDAQTGQLRLVISPDGTVITAAQWNQAGDRLLIATEGGVARIYDTDMDRLVDAACQAATRNFTWAEWQLYFPGEPYRPICPELPVHPSVPQPAASP